MKCNGRNVQTLFDIVEGIFYDAELAQRKVAYSFYGEKTNAGE